MELPEAPSLALLSYNTKIKSSDGLQSLTTPPKVLTQWHDSSFKDEFREFLKEMREKYPLDVPPKQARGAEGEDPNPKPGKKPRGAGAANTAAAGSPAEGPKPDDFIAVEDLRVPLTHESTLPSNNKLQIVVTVGNGCYLLNKTDDAQVCKAGTALAGYYKGKFETSTSKPTGNDVVCFQLTSSANKILMGGKMVSVAEAVKQRRLTNPSDAHIAFHEMRDDPQPTDPGAFQLSTKPSVWLGFHAQAFPAPKQEPSDDSSVLRIPSVHLAGAIPAGQWENCPSWAGMSWATKWPPVVSKGLQPIRPIVISFVNLSIPPKKALRVLQPEG